jgi:hypothetical protein
VNHQNDEFAQQQVEAAQQQALHEKIAATCDVPWSTGRF